jgi:hypothetical protein
MPGADKIRFTNWITIFLGLNKMICQSGSFQFINAPDGIAVE